MKKATGDLERAIRHWSIAASTGCYCVMHELRDLFERSAVRRESINFNFGSIQYSCTEMRSEASYAYISAITE